MLEISEIDKHALRAIRDSVQSLLQKCFAQFDEEVLRL